MNQEEQVVTAEGAEKVKEALGSEVKCQCPKSSMEEWISQDDPHKDDPRFCRPCQLGITASWYCNELQEQGHRDLASIIEQVVDKLNDPNMPLTLCKQFDIIKDVVEEPLRERLKDFDCATQSFNPDDVAEDSATAASKSREEDSQDG